MPKIDTCQQCLNKTCVCKNCRGQIYRHARFCMCTFGAKSDDFCDLTAIGAQTDPNKPLNKE
jgi:hypothetical protein